MRHGDERAIRLARIAAVVAAGSIAAAAGYSVLAGRGSRARLPATGSLVDVCDARLHVLDLPAHQSAQPPDDATPPLLMLHGLAGQTGHYTHSLVGRLQKRHRLIVVDRPGSGHSVWQPRSADDSDADAGVRDAIRVGDLDAQAAVMLALLDRLQIPRVIVVGHSMGGALALAMALRAPQRIAGLSLLAPLTGMTPQLARVFGAWSHLPPWLVPLVGWTLAVPLIDLRRSTSLGAVFAPESVPIDYRAAGGGDAHRRPEHLIGAMRDLSMLGRSLTRQQSRYCKLTMPIDVLYGRQDRVLQAELQTGCLGDACTIGVRWLDDAGHMLPVTRSADCEALIERTVERVRAVDAAKGTFGEPR